MLLLGVILSSLSVHLQQGAQLLTLCVSSIRLIPYVFCFHGVPRPQNGARCNDRLPTESNPLEATLAVRHVPEASMRGT